MKDSCIIHPPEKPLIIVREWQVLFCKGNPCSAALLSFFTYWHDIKIAMKEKNIKENEIRERNGDTSKLSTTLHQFHSEEDLEDGIMGIWKRDSIRKALKELEDTGVIEVTKNPNPKYAFDKTRYFILHPEVANEYLIERYFEDAKTKNRTRSSEKPSPSAEKPSTITETTSEITYREDIYFIFTFNSLETDADVREAFAQTSPEAKKKGIIRFAEDAEQGKICLWVYLPKKKPFALVSAANLCNVPFDPLLVAENALESFQHDEDVYKYFRKLSDRRFEVANQKSIDAGMTASVPPTEEQLNKYFNH